MYVQVKSSNGITTMPVTTKLLAHRRIFIEGEITADTALEFTKLVMHLNDEDREKPIDVFVNSPGGEINAGLLIYDVIQTSEAPIRMYCLGRAYSMAAVLFACGNHGRYMLPNSELMLHEPLLGNRVSGSSSSIKSISDSLIETKKRINALLAKHTGQSEKAIAKATGFDHYFTPEESIAFGLCDEIVTFSKTVEG